MAKIGVFFSLFFFPDGKQNPQRSVFSTVLIYCSFLKVDLYFKYYPFKFVKLIMKTWWVYFQHLFVWGGGEAWPPFFLSQTTGLL